MPKRPRGATAAGKASKAKKRAVARYGAAAVQKYYARASTFAPETKYFDTAFAATVTAAGTDWSSTEVAMTSYVNSSGAIAAYTDSALIPSAQGTGYGQVVGNKYKLKALRIKGFVKCAVTTALLSPSETRLCRVLLVMDKQPNGAQAQGEDIMQDMGGGVNNINSYMRVSEGAGRRFTVLADKMLRLHPTGEMRSGALAADPIQASLSFQSPQFSFAYSPKKPLEVQIKSGNATPTIAGLVSANIFLLLFGVDAAGTAIAHVINGNARAYYCD